MKIQEFDLRAIKYKKGWMFYLEAPNEETPVYRLMIVSHTTNSYKESEMVHVRHEFMVPPADYAQEVWLAWIFDRVRDIEANHEAGEFFRWHDIRVFAPHHGNGQDPYRVWFMGDYEQTRTKAGDNDQM